jgi:RND family efflux transporter MFP subunit
MSQWQRILLLLPWFAALLGCNGMQASLPPAKLPQVQVSLPISREVKEYEDFTGQTQALQTIEVRARVSGYLSKIYFLGKEGTEVHRDDPLFEIDPRPYQVDLAQAQANVVQSEARAQRLKLDLQRAQKLIGRGFVSQEDFDKIAGDKLEAEAALGSAKAALERAKLNMEFTTVKAPISGRISRRLMDEWNMVKADETVLTTIVSQDPMYANFDVDEADVLKLRRLVREGKITALDDPNVRVELGLADEVGFPTKGTVDFVDNQVDANTGTLRMRAIFPNPDRLLSPGLFVRIRLPIGAPHKALLVAEQALGRDQGQKFLYVVNQDKVEYRRVRVGRLYDGLREIIEGLAPGEKVIVSGLQRVRPEVEVEAEVVAMPRQGSTTETRP